MIIFHQLLKASEGCVIFLREWLAGSFILIKQSESSNLPMCTSRRDSSVVRVAEQPSDESYETVGNGRQMRLPAAFSSIF